MKGWLNGKYVGDDSGRIGLDDRGLLLADGIFETLLVRQARPAFFEGHMARLRQGAAVLEIPVPYSDGEVLDVLQAMAQTEQNSRTDLSARITLTRGGGARGIALPAPSAASPSLFITMAPLSIAEPAPLPLTISSVRRNDGSPSCHLKSLAYTDNILARKEASTLGAEDAIMLNSRGNVCCTTIANIFLLQEGGILRTPDISSGILPGITRKHVLQLAAEAGFTVAESAVSPGDLKSAVLFVTNSLQGLRPAYLLEDDAETARPAGQSEELLELQTQYAQKLKKDLVSRKPA